MERVQSMITTHNKRSLCKKILLTTFLIICFAAHATAVVTEEDISDQEAATSLYAEESDSLIAVHEAGTSEKLAIAAAAQAELEATRISRIAGLKNARTALDSLNSCIRLQEVDVDAALVAAKVSLKPCSRSVVTNMIDPDFVEVDVPYSTWTQEQKDSWNSTRLASNIDHQNSLVIGRYKMNYQYVPAFLAMTKTFVESLEVVEVPILEER